MRRRRPPGGGGAAAPLLVLAAALTLAGATRPPPPTLPPPPVYDHFAELLASVLVVREGGLEAAMRAVPLLHDTTHAYLNTLSLLSTHPNWTDWKGMSDASAARIIDAAKRDGGLNGAAKAAVAAIKRGDNLTDTDPLAEYGDRLEDALRQAGKLDVPPSVEAKANATTAKLTAAVGAVIPDKDDDVLKALNAKLARYNIEVSNKDVGEPKKFDAAAQAVARYLTGVTLDVTGVDFCPCLISVQQTGISAGFNGLQIMPSVIDIENDVAQAMIEGVNIQPSLLIVSPIGAEFQPQGLQIAPLLAAVSPIGANFQPTGLAVTPNHLSISPTGKAIAPIHRVDAPVDIAWAPVDIDITPNAAGTGDDLPDDESGDGLQAGPDGAGGSERRRRRLAALRVPAPKHKVTLSPDPLDLALPHDYRNWGALLAQVLLKKEDDVHAATAALARVALDVHGMLARAADGEVLVPRFSLHDPVFLGGKEAGLPPIQASPFESSASFVNFHPCVLAEQTTGVEGFFTGLQIAPSVVNVINTAFDLEVDAVSIAPSMVYVSVEGLQANPQGINVQPALLMVQPEGINFQPQGLNVQPVLANIAPTGLSVMPTGHLLAAAHKVIAPTHISYSPQGITNAPIKIDLTAPPAVEGGAAPAAAPGPGRAKRRAVGAAPAPG